MRRNSNAAIAINDKSSRQRIDAAIKLTDRIVAEKHMVIHLVRCNERFNGWPALVIHRHSHYFQPTALHLLLKLNKPRYFQGARPAPGSPKIQQNNFPAKIAQLY